MPLLKGRAPFIGVDYSMFGAAKRDRAFKDYCLILQVHPEADAAMVDAAYWHLAKRYNEASAYDPQARAKLEELNEAYIVLGSAEKREEYMKVRAEILGEGALPQAPRPAPLRPPLTVMSRQRPRERATLEIAGERRTPLSVRNLAGAFGLLGLIGVGLATTVSLATAAAVGVAVVTILAVTGVVGGLARLRGMRRASSPHPARHSALGAGPSDSGGAAGDPLGKIRSQAEQLRRLAAEPSAAPIEMEPAWGVEAGQTRELQPPAPTGSAELQAVAAIEFVAEEPQQPRDETLERDPVAQPGHDQFAQIKRQAAQFRRIAESQSDHETHVTQGEGAEAGPEQLAKIKQQTERLKSIAAKFNAAKGGARPDSTPKD